MQTTQQLPLVSIIMPNYNCGRFIGEAIESVLAQTYPEWELLIQDDASTDNSLDVILEYARKDPRIKPECNERNMDASITRNRAIARSGGRYLAFLDSDDRWLPHKLERQLEFMRENNCDFSFTRYEHMSENGKPLGVRARVVNRLSYRRLLHHCWPGCLTVMYRQDPRQKIFSEDITQNNDHALFLKVIKQCSNARGMNECTALYRIRKGSVSRRKLKMIKPYIQVIRDFEGHSYLFALWCVFTHVFVKLFLKYGKVRNTAR